MLMFLICAFVGLNAQNPYTVEIVTLYNRSALEFYGSHNEARENIQRYISETNTAFTNSGVNAKLVSVGIEYSNVSDLLDAVDRRNELCADIGALISNNEVTFYGEEASGCGRAARFEDEDHDDALAIWANPVDCNNSYTFTHEIGHVFDANHDANNDNNCIPHCGLQYCDDGWRTVMAYRCEDSRTEKILFYSNPSISYEGLSTGTNHANNVERMNEIASEVSCYNGGSEANCGVVGTTVSSYKWSEGWTTFRFYEVGNQLYMFQLKESGVGDSGYNVHLRRVNSNGSIGQKIASYKWSEGWTSVQFYEINGETFMFQLKERGVGDSGYNAHVRKVNSDGTLSKTLTSYKWSEGWTNIEFYEQNGKVYLFQSKKTGLGDSGYNVHIREVLSNGYIGGKINSYRWSEGWTTFEFYENQGELYLLQLKEAGRGDSGFNVHIRKVSSGVFTRIHSDNWTEGWTNVEFFKRGTACFMLQVKKEGEGRSCFNAHVKRVNIDGSIGAKSNSYNWSEGWTTFEFYEVYGNHYVLQVKAEGVGISGSNAHVRRL